MVDRLERFTARIDFSSFEQAQAALLEPHAFMDARDAERRGLHLSMPRS